MSYMFYGFKPKSLDISTWHPDSCINMEGMFMNFGTDSLDKNLSAEPYSTTLKLPKTANT